MQIVGPPAEKDEVRNCDECTWPVDEWATICCGIWFHPGMCLSDHYREKHPEQWESRKADLLNPRYEDHYQYQYGRRIASRN